MAKKVKINKDRCIGCGTCTFIYKELFYLDDDGKAEVREIKNIDEKKLKEAEKSCPVKAIEIKE